MSIASDKLVKECEEKMLKTIEAVKEKFTAIRAGRANVSMLDGVKVDNYGSEVKSSWYCICTRSKTFSY